MTPTMLFVMAAVLVTLLVYLAHRRSRTARARTFDVGVVSTRWLSELRRDEPWTSS